jgi:hypothetical protein
MIMISLLRRAWAREIPNSLRSKIGSMRRLSIPPYRAVIKHGDIYLPDPNGLPGEIILVDPAEPEDLDDSTVLNLDQD